jgi:hypothetical protein
MLQEIEKIREFHFVKKCKLGNEGCPVFYLNFILSHFLFLSNISHFGLIFFYIERKNQLFFGILHVRPKVVYTFCDFEKTPFFLICNIFLQNQHVTGD